MAQIEVGNKEHEITKAPGVIRLAKVGGKVVTGDALHTQKRLAQTILDEQGDYIFPVKENQPNLYKTSNLYSPQNIPSPASAKFKPIFSRHKK